MIVYTDVQVGKLNELLRLPICKQMLYNCLALCLLAQGFRSHRRIQLGLFELRFHWNKRGDGMGSDQQRKVLEILKKNRGTWVEGRLLNSCNSSALFGLSQYSSFLTLWLNSQLSSTIFLYIYSKHILLLTIFQSISGGQSKGEGILWQTPAASQDPWMLPLFFNSLQDEYNLDNNIKWS